ICSPCGRRGKERFVAFVRCVILLNEVAYVDLTLPQAAGEAIPRLRRLVPFDLLNCCSHENLPCSRGGATAQRVNVLSCLFAPLRRCVKTFFYAAAFASPSNAPVCRAIINSSLVGMTQTE